MNVHRNISDHPRSENIFLCITTAMAFVYGDLDLDLDLDSGLIPADVDDIHISVDKSPQQEFFEKVLHLYQRYLYDRIPIKFKSILDLIIEGVEPIYHNDLIERRFQVFVNCFCSMIIDSSLLFPDGTATRFCGYYSLSAAVDTHPDKPQIIDALHTYVRKLDPARLGQLDKGLLIDPMIIKKIIAIMLRISISAKERALFGDYIYSMLEKDTSTSKLIIDHALKFHYSTPSPFPSKMTYASLKDNLRTDPDTTKTFMTQPSIINGCIDAFINLDIGVIHVIINVFARIIKKPLYWVMVSNQPQTDRSLQVIRPYTLWYAEHLLPPKDRDTLPLRGEPLFMGQVREFGHVLPVIPLWRLSDKWSSRWISKLDYMKTLCQYTHDHHGIQIMNAIIASKTTPIDFAKRYPQILENQSMTSLILTLYNIDAYGGNPPDALCH